MNKNFKPGTQVRMIDSGSSWYGSQGVVIESNERHYDNAFQTYVGITFGVGAGSIYGFDNDELEAI